MLFVCLFFVFFSHRIQSNIYIQRACPECRVESNYVCPSLFWVDTKEEKESLLKDYKDALNGQHCKYFNRVNRSKSILNSCHSYRSDQLTFIHIVLHLKGEGSCPFGNKCFYKHALPSGELIDVGKPQKRRCFDQDLESNIVEVCSLLSTVELAFILNC